jgi:hypothetical protein
MYCCIKSKMSWRSVFGAHFVSVTRSLLIDLPASAFDLSIKHALINFRRINSVFWVSRNVTL